MNQTSLNKETCVRIALGFLLLAVIIFYFDNNIEMFGNYKSSCNYLPKAIQHALDKRKMKKVNDNSWDYYLPCGYTRCESNVLAFKSERTGKKIFMIDGCDWIASKVGLWRLIRRGQGSTNCRNGWIDSQRLKVYGLQRYRHWLHDAQCIRSFK